jgi:hypothetical protein
VHCHLRLVSMCRSRKNRVKIAKIADLIPHHLPVPLKSSIYRTLLSWCDEIANIDASYDYDVKYDCDFAFTYLVSHSNVVR